MPRLSSEERRAALVQAALVVIGRDGVQAATTRAIVAEAGMPLASFHYAFRSRDELIRDVITAVVENEEQVAADSLDGLPDLRTMVRVGLQAYFGLLREHPNREQAMFELMFYSMRTPGLEGMHRTQHGAYLRSGEQLVQSATDALGIRWSVPIPEVARVLIAMNDGLTLAWLADRDDAAAAKLMDVIADTIVGLAVRVSA